MFTSKKPVILVPGFAGSKLVVKTAPVKSKPVANEFINLNVFDKRWDNEFALKIDKPTGRVDLCDNIDVVDFGGVEGIRNLCNNCEFIDNVLGKITREKMMEKMYNYRYYDSFISNMELLRGYKSGVDLYGAPYDFRKVGVREYMEGYLERFKMLCERSREEHGRAALVVAHSLGALIIYILLAEYTSDAWKLRHIDRFVSVSAPFGGCSISLKTCLSGYPKLMLLKDRYLPIMQTSTGIALAFPNTIGYGGSKTLLWDKTSSAKFGVTDFKDALPQHMRNLWESNTRDLVPSFIKNTGVPTSIVTASNDYAEVTYVYKSLDKTENVEPEMTGYTKGDMLIPHDSLRVHEKMRLQFPNYSFHDITFAEHTSILSDSRFLDLILGFL